LPASGNFWGIIENFHEGRYLDFLLQNLGLMLVQYISNMHIIITLACDLSLRIALSARTAVPLPTNSIVLATVPPYLTAIVQPSQVESTEVIYGRLSLVIPIISAILANYIKTGDEGMAFGLDNSVTAAGRGVAPLLGAGVATGWGYPLTFVVTGLVFTTSTVLAVWKLPATRPATADISVSSSG